MDNFYQAVERRKSFILSRYNEIAQESSTLFRYEICQMIFEELNKKDNLFPYLGARQKHPTFLLRLTLASIVFYVLQFQKSGEIKAYVPGTRGTTAEKARKERHSFICARAAQIHQYHPHVSNFDVSVMVWEELKKMRFPHYDKKRERKNTFTYVLKECARLGF